MNAPAQLIPRPTATPRCSRSARTTTTLPENLLRTACGSRTVMAPRDAGGVARGRCGFCPRRAFIGHQPLLRPGHPREPQKKSSRTRRPPTTNKFVAFDFLTKRQHPRPAGVLVPMCQDHRHRDHPWARRAGWCSPRAKGPGPADEAGGCPKARADAYLKTESALFRSSRRSPCSRRRIRRTNMPAQVEIYAEGEDAYKAPVRSPRAAARPTRAVPVPGHAVDPDA